MKNIEFLCIKSWQLLCRFLIFILFISISTIAYAQQDQLLRSSMSYNSRLHSFYDDQGNWVQMHIFKGLTPETREYNIIFEGIANPNGLLKYKSRTESYLRVLLNLAFQPEFELGNMMQVYNGNNADIDLQTSLGLLSTLTTSGDLSIAFTDMAAEYSNLKYVKNINELKVIQNKLKTSGRHIRAGSLHNLSNALAALGFVLSSHEVFTEVKSIIVFSTLMDAVMFDLGLARLHLVQETVKVNDPAFYEAMDAAISILQDLPDDFWKKLLLSVDFNATTLENASLAFADALNNLLSLYILNNPKLASWSPITGWLFAGIFTVKQVKLIQNFEESLRDAQTTMTIFKEFEKRLPSNPEDLEHDINEYLQYHYTNKMWESVSNNYIGSLGWFFNGYRLLRDTYREELQWVESGLIKSRLYRYFNSFKKSQTGIMVGFLLDSSGSMRQTDPKNIRRSAIRQIIDYLKGDEMVFIIDFDNRANWLNQDHYEKWDRHSLKRFIDMVDSDGGTDIGLGLDKMKQVMENRMNGEEKAAVLLFTDGMGAYNNNAQWFAEQGIPVYTVSYKDEADAALMQDIAITTNAHFLQANDETEIAQAFILFMNALYNYSMICNISGQIMQNQSLSYDFLIDQQTTEMNASLSWPGSKIGMKLTAPDQKIYEESSLGEWTIGRNYSNFSLAKPAAGTWTVELIGVQIPGNSEPFSFSVSSDSPARYELRNVLKDDGTIHLTLSGNFLPEVTDLEPNVSVITPFHLLYDISSTYKDGEIIFRPVDGPGNYKFELKFSKQLPGVGDVQRYLSASIYLGDYVPSYAGFITGTLGNYVTAGIGRRNGNRPGINCRIYRISGSTTQPIAEGYVTNVEENHCTIRIQRYLSGNYKINEGDVARLDIRQWQADEP